MEKIKKINSEIFEDIRAMAITGRITKLSTPETRRLRELIEWATKTTKIEQETPETKRAIILNIYRIALLYLQETEATKLKAIETGERKDKGKHSDKCRRALEFGKKAPTKKVKDLTNFKKSQRKAVESLKRLIESEKEEDQAKRQAITGNPEGDGGSLRYFAACCSSDDWEDKQEKSKSMRRLALELSPFSGVSLNWTGDESEKDEETREEAEEKGGEIKTSRINTIARMRAEKIPEVGKWRAKNLYFGNWRTLKDEAKTKEVTEWETKANERTRNAMSELINLGYSLKLIN